MVTFDTRRVAWVLGQLGLIPFVACALAGFFDITLLGRDSIAIFVSYSAVILSFLSGSLWANAAHQGLSRAAAITMILSNVFCLSAWLSLLLGAGAISLTLLTVAYPLLWLAERRVRESLHESYIRLRTILTWVVFVAHLLALLALK